ncbi:MAG: lyase family protein [Solirubrobacteraceae bacterium]
MSPAAAGLFGGLYGAGDAAAALADPAWLQAMLDFEAALARSGAAEGLIPAQSAEVIAAACRAERFDPDALGHEAAPHATPVVPLVAALRSAVGQPHADYVHQGATSQDVIDTAVMLVTRRACAPLLEDAGAASAAAARLAQAHARTPMVGRTVLQQALPVSFGLVAAGWSQVISDAAARLRGLVERELPVQFGGPVGSASPKLAAGVAAELGLCTPALPWHTNRVVPASLAGELAVLAGALGKVARDVTMLAAHEVGEVREGGDGARGASSAMHHKRNPVAAVSVLACSKRTPGLAATMLSAMEQEHQRAAGAWQSEWGTLRDLLGLTASAAAGAREMLEHLVPDPERMRSNLAAMAAAGVAEAEDPEAQLGAAEELIARALASRPIADHLDQGEP